MIHSKKINKPALGNSIRNFFCAASYKENAKTCKKHDIYSLAKTCYLNKVKKNKKEASKVFAA